MKKRDSLFYHISIFVIAQLAWMGLLGLWIYFYVTNYIIFEKVGDQLAPQIDIDNPNVMVFVGGIILIVAVAVGMSFLFRGLNVQFKLANLYDSFIGNVTHELKSPLASIQLYLQTLRTRDVPPEKQKEFLDLMIQDADRLKNLINSILEISMLEQKKVAHDFKIFNATDILKKLLAESSEQFKLTGDMITIEGSADCDCVIDDRAIKMVFDNLIDNAKKYSTGEVKINVKLKDQFRNIIITFSDKGIGIPQSQLKNVFNKFHRIYNSKIPNVKGTGLGLYWVKEILRFHGGKISVTSEGENDGTTFKIELPVYHSTEGGITKRLLKRTEKRLAKNAKIEDE